MKKYFSKLIVVFLLVSIFQMASTLCFQNLFSFKVTNTAQATAEKNIVSSLPDVVALSEMSVCNDVAFDESQINQPTMKVNAVNIKRGKSAPHSNNNNSLLPCCQEGGHPNIISSSQSFGIEKFIPILISFNANNLTISVPQATAYDTPILLPPELLSIKKTTLRI